MYFGETAVGQCGESWHHAAAMSYTIDSCNNHVQARAAVSGSPAMIGFRPLRSVSPPNPIPPAVQRYDNMMVQKWIQKWIQKWHRKV